MPVFLREGPGSEDIHGDVSLLSWRADIPEIATTVRAVTRRSRCVGSGATRLTFVRVDRLGLGGVVVRQNSLV
jgi:hypothetical protein